MKSQKIKVSFQVWHQLNDQTTYLPPTHSRVEATLVESRASLVFGSSYLIWAILSALPSSEGCFRDHKTTGMCECFVGLKCYGKPRQDTTSVHLSCSLGKTRWFLFAKVTPFILRVAAPCAPWEADSETESGCRRFSREWCWDPHLEREENRPRLREELRCEAVPAGPRLRLWGLWRWGEASELSKAVQGALCQPVIGGGLPREGGVSSHRRLAAEGHRQWHPQSGCKFIIPGRDFGCGLFFS